MERLAIEAGFILLAGIIGVIFSDKVKNLFRKEENKVKSFSKKELDKLRAKGL